MRTKDLDKQKRIKEAMVRLILREGIDGTSISKIAREAGVSQATIYVYYNSKEDMLAEVFREYSQQSFRYMENRICPDMSGKEFIEAVVRCSYAFSVEHEEVFSFVEQCSRNPYLSGQVCERECSCGIMDMIHRYQAEEKMMIYDDWNVMAMLLAPIRFLAVNRESAGQDSDKRLEELVTMIQNVLLR